MKNTFRGGVHPSGWRELSREQPLRRFDAKGEMVFPLVQHIGRPASPIVKKGDEVLVGQRIAEATGYVSAHIISSCSGKVKAIEKRRTVSGAMLECIVVDNDGLYTKAEGFGERDSLAGITREEILRRVSDAGIVGLGGAGFPTHVKLSPQNPDAIRYIIANGAECEPYLTCNDQLMRTCAADIVEGLEIMLRLFPNAQGVIAIEDNKPEAIAAMQAAAQGKDKLRVMPLQAKYPQGGERSLISVIAGIDYPTAKLSSPRGNHGLIRLLMGASGAEDNPIPPMLPADAGCIVENVGTIYAIQRAVVFHEPLFSHCMTLTGDAVKQPGNYIVRDGTSFAELLEEAGGLKEGVTLKKALAGGPMMGLALSTMDLPIQKQNNGLTLLAEDENEAAEAGMTACLHCGRCTTVCPVGLMPQLMADAVAAGDLNRYENKLYGLECMQCGSCTYICPAKRPLMQTFKQTKAEIMDARRRAQAGR